MAVIGREMSKISRAQQRSPRRLSGRVVFPLILQVATAAAFVSSCAVPYMTAEGCADFCHAEGKKVATYTTGAQIPIIHPRPSTRCVCEGSPAE